MLKFERRHQALARPAVFRRRLGIAVAVGLALVGLSLALGTAGYMLFEHLGALDAFLNASMLLSGMGPLHHPSNTGGKVFAALFALYSGFAVLGIAGIIFAPVVHRVFHRFHIPDKDSDKD